MQYTQESLWPETDLGWIERQSEPRRRPRPVPPAPKVNKPSRTVAGTRYNYSADMPDNGK